MALKYPLIGGIMRLHAISMLVVLVSIPAYVIGMNQVRAEQRTLTCEDKTESLILELSGEDVAAGMANSLIAVCALGMKVAEDRDEQQHQDNLQLLDNSMTKSGIDHAVTARLKNAYLIGYLAGH